MKRSKMLLILAAVILYGAAILFCQSAKEDANRTYLLLSEPIDAARAEEIFVQEGALEEGVGFCFWGEQKHQWVSCKETGTIAEVTKVLLSGNPGLLDAPELTWQEGCLLDEATAQTLFGTADCSEQSARQEDRPYRVLGTRSAMQPTMIAAAEESDGLILNRCVLDVPAETGQQTARQFLLRWGLAGDVIDYYPMWVLTYDLLLAVPLLLLCRGYALGKRRARSRVKRLLLLLTTLCLLSLLAGRIRFLPDMFPSRWSDFSFWGNWWEGQKQNLQLLLRTPMGEGHLQMLLNMVKSLVCTMVSLGLTLPYKCS